MTGPAAAARATLAWGAALWWTTTRRRWRQTTGALMLGLVLGLVLGVSTFSHPAGREPLFLTIELLLGMGAIVAAPLVLRGASILSSRRIDLLPLAPPSLWALRIALANPLRTFLSGIVAAWGAFLPLHLGLSPGESALLLLQVAGSIWFALALSQLLQDLIEKGRAVVLHQIVFLTALAAWPLILEYLRSADNFLPPPAWTLGPAGSLLVGGGSPWMHLVATIGLLLAGAGFFQLDRWVLARFTHRPAAPPASVRWTARVGRLLTAPFDEAWILQRVILIPLRFLFLRMTLVFVALTTAAALLTGIPYLLLALPFWWQPLSTNALGPDVGGGELRNRLLGLSPALTLKARTSAAVLLTLVIVLLIAMLLGIPGWIARPRLGPDSHAMYLVATLYALSLIVLTDTAGDRYSLRFPDILEMHTLLPERSRSAGAVAIALLFAIWLIVALLATAMAGIGHGFARILDRHSLDAVGLGITLVVGAAGNLALYLLHRRTFLRGRP